MSIAVVTDLKPTSGPAVNKEQTATDARPLIPRNATNLWTQAEKIRDDLYRQFKEVCTVGGVQPLLLASGPYAFPCWVKFEAWQPCEVDGSTERSSVFVTIDPRPYYTHPFEFEIVYEAQRKKRTVKRTMPLSDGEVLDLVRFLLQGGAKPRFRRFREAPFQLWRENNKLEGLRRDWLAILFALALAAGFGTIVLLPFALIFWALAAYVYVRMRKRRATVRIDGKPDGEPRSLIRVDSWQTVLFNLGRDEAMVRERFSSAVHGGKGQQCRFGPERVWYWGIDGKEEREQLVLLGGRGLVFCQIYRYGEDLYVGWDGHLNRGQWIEQTVASGIDKESGDPVTITRVVPGTQPTSEYDLVDLSCLMEWTHAQMVKLLKQLIAEKKIDQEIDFKIHRAEREKVAASGSAADHSREGLRRSVFQRTS
jgi:hypothetical protein